MVRIDKDIERLIVRRLDGALTEDEELELNRALIRDPDAQTLIEDYQRVDALATAALNDVLGEDAASFDVSTLTPRVPPQRWSARYHRGWWLMPGAVAAALVAMIIPSPSFDRGVVEPTGVQPPPQVVHAPNVGRIDPFGAAQRPYETPVVNRNVSGLPRAKGQTVRDVLGVMGDDGNLYWIEVDRSRRIRQAPQRIPAEPRGEL